MKYTCIIVYTIGYTLTYVANAYGRIYGSHIFTNLSIGLRTSNSSARYGCLIFFVIVWLVIMLVHMCLYTVYILYTYLFIVAYLEYLGVPLRFSIIKLC